MGHLWDDAADSGTDVALSSNRHRVGVGGTWNVPGRWALGLVLPENAEPYRMVGRPSRPGQERLSRSCGGVCRGNGPTIVTLEGRGRSSVMGAGVTTPRRGTSTVILMPAVWGTAAPATHSFFPCLKHRSVSVMCGKSRE